MQQRDVYWLEDLGKEYNDLFGKKSANLGEMTKVEGICVPPGFAISIAAYENFARETGLHQEIENYLKNSYNQCVGPADFQKLQQVSHGVRNIVESKEVIAYLKQDIASYYKSLCERCGSTETAVSVRSAGAKSHPGQYETYLNVAGFDHVLDKILRVWSSIYNTTSISAALRQAVPIQNCPPLGVCVLKMVNAKAAGVCLTVHPITGDNTQAMVESNWGLGESVVSGAVTPDKFIVDKVKMKIKESITGKKEKRLVMKERGIVVEEFSPDRPKELSLTEKEVISIVQFAKRLEKHFGIPQDIEWAIDMDSPTSRNIFILQARPQVSIPQKKSITDQIADMMIRRHRT
jgi:pyruvate,water dikinase